MECKKFDLRRILAAEGHFLGRLVPSILALSSGVQTMQANCVFSSRGVLFSNRPDGDRHGRRSQRFYERGMVGIH